MMEENWLLCAVSGIDKNKCASYFRDVLLV